MIFFLATLPSSDYSVLQQIFQLYEESYKRKPSKSSIPTKADCKGSNFRGLRNLDIKTVSFLLNEVANQSLPLQNLNARCQEIKKVQGLKKKFSELVGVSSWEEAQESYPEFANEQKLKHKFLSSYQKNIQLLEDYCKKAMSRPSNSPALRG